MSALSRRVADATRIEVTDTETNRALEARLALVDQPLQRRPMPTDASVPVRLATSPQVRRFVPTRLSVGAAAAFGRLAWRTDPERRERAIRAAQAILGGTSREADVESVARARLVQAAVAADLFWQPRQDFVLADPDIETLKMARAGGRAVIVSMNHLHPFAGIATAMARDGRAAYLVSGGFLFDSEVGGVWGRRVAQMHEIHRRGNVRLVAASDRSRVIESYRAFGVMEALVRRSETLVIAFDVPGSVETSFLGKPVMLAAGTSNLAFRTKAIVLPIRSRLQGHRVGATFGEPIDPLIFADAGALHDAIASVHERWILETPELLEDPRRAGAWEGGATAARWSRPADARRPGIS